ncbi:MAG: tRNA threonylcarbamoyladenosine dehydratase [Bacteroidales bacterium]|nr:tRNA threonylcarbamoyladenosine dehydratase [Bacteroidales bacterium]HOY38812.1 tRNA threonylcarbamoyladenosine dehydratase [Bacteroidales bacterium]HQP04954.1 tRNA threonylcarbamoyladenosine dehydratase [Bacteroidales bacterium]
MNWNERTILLLGSEKVKVLENSHVLVAGLGGVGAYVAEMLCRAGVGKLSLIDADVVNPSNLNRQLIALRSNIGKAKPTVMEQRLKEINPDIELLISEVFLKDEKIDEALSIPYDFVADAIDTLSPKINFIKTCLENKLPLISSMGAGGKTDPEKVKIDDISKSYNCNLARILRKRLHRLGIREGFRVVYSSEKADKSSVIEEESLNKKSNVGTISYMPAIFGCFMAAEIIRSLTEKPE